MAIDKYCKLPYIGITRTGYCTRKELIMYLELLFIKLANLFLKKYRGFLARIDKMLPIMASGSLQCWESYGVKSHFYETNQNGKKTRVRIYPGRSGEQDLIDDITTKKILAKGRKIMLNNISALEFMLRHFQIYDPISICNDMGMAYDPDDANITKAFMDGDIDPAAWKRAPYNKSTFHPEHLKFPTKAGEMVRSKSEAMIYEILTKREEIFRYECELDLIMYNKEGRSIAHRTVSPDFMILRRSDRRVLIYEHLGKMDDEDYVNKNMKKIEDYIAAGYIPGENLIITWETASMPFTLSKAVAAIESYLGKAE